MESVKGEKAMEHSANTGAIVYWQNAEDSAARIAADIETLDRIGQILSN